MKKIFLTLISLTLFASCSHKYTPSSSAMINVTNYEIGDTNKLKTGEACITRVLGFSGFNSSTSVIDAMKNGNISTIKMIDSRFFVVPLFFSKNCTVVHGL